MNLWFASIVAGLVLALDNIAELVSIQSPSDVSIKEKRLMAGIRGVSGFVVMGCAYLVITLGLWGAGMKVTSVSALEGLFYALGTAGFFRILVGLFSVPGFIMFGLRRSIRLEANKAYLGGYLFLAAGVGMGIVDKTPIVIGIFLVLAFFFLGIQFLIPLIIRRPSRSHAES